MASVGMVVYIKDSVELLKFILSSAIDTTLILARLRMHVCQIWARKMHLWQIWSGKMHVGWQNIHFAIFHQKMQEDASSNYSISFSAVLMHPLNSLICLLSFVQSQMFDRILELCLIIIKNLDVNINFTSRLQWENIKKRQVSFTDKGSDET